MNMNFLIIFLLSGLQSWMASPHGMKVKIRCDGANYRC